MHLVTTAQRDRVYQMRSINHFVPLTCRTNISQRCIEYFGPILWNRLPVHLQMITSYGVFTHQLRLHLLTCCNTLPNWSLLFLVSFRFFTLFPLFLSRSYYSCTKLYVLLPVCVGQHIAVCASVHYIRFPLLTLLFLLLFIWKNNDIPYFNRLIYNWINLPIMYTVKLLNR